MNDKLKDIVERAMQPFSLLALAPQMRESITRACEQWGKIVDTRCTEVNERMAIKKDAEIQQLRQQLEEQFQQPPHLVAQRLHEMETKLQQAEADRKRLDWILNCCEHLRLFSDPDEVYVDRADIDEAMTHE